MIFLFSIRQIFHKANYWFLFIRNKLFLPEYLKVIQSRRGSFEKTTTTGWTKKKRNATHVMKKNTPWNMQINVQGLQKNKTSRRRFRLAGIKKVLLTGWWQSSSRKEQEGRKQEHTKKTQNNLKVINIIKNALVYYYLLVSPFRGSLIFILL